MHGATKSITVNISDVAYRQLKEAAERESITLEAFAAAAIERWVSSAIFPRRT
jgi:hypothetical protein